MRRKIYIAGRYSRRDEFRGVRNILEKCGYYVTSRWLDEDKPLECKMGEESSEWYYETQRHDLEDIFFADEVLFFAEDPLVGTPRGGRHVEFGYALARRTPIHVIGPYENVFHYATGVKHYPTLEAFVATTHGR